MALRDIVMFRPTDTSLTVGTGAGQAQIVFCKDFFTGDDLSTEGAEFEVNYGLGSYLFHCPAISARKVVFKLALVDAPSVSYDGLYEDIVVERMVRNIMART